MKRPPPRSLFVMAKPKSKLASELTEDQLQKHILTAINGPDPAYCLDAALAKIQRDADIAAALSAVPDGGRHAERIHEGLTEVRREVSDVNVAREQLAYTAIKLAESWMQMRMDAIAAKHVRSAHDRIPKPRATDTQISERIKRGGTQLEMAADLNMTDRQLRNRLKEIQRKKQIKRK